MNQNALGSPRMYERTPETARHDMLDALADVQDHECTTATSFYIE